MCIYPQPVGIDEWFIDFFQGTREIGLSGGSPSCVVISNSPTTWNSNVHSMNTWYETGCIAHSSDCGQHFVTGEVYYENDCFYPGYVYIQLDCGNGIIDLELQNNWETTCCGLFDCIEDSQYFGFFEVKDDCSIVSETGQPADPNRPRPCEATIDSPLGP